MIGLRNVAVYSEDELDNILRSKPVVEPVDAVESCYATRGTSFSADVEWD